MWKACAVSDFFSLAVYEVIFDSDSPGVAPQAAQTMASKGRATVRTKAADSQARVDFIADSLCQRLRAAVQGRACNWLKPGDKQAGWTGKCVRRRDSREGWRHRGGRRIR